MAERLQGTVKFYDLRRGYGFIVPDDGGADVFVHHSAVSRAGLPALLAGMRLSFRLVPAARGRRPQADHLLLLEPAPTASSKDRQDVNSLKEAAE